jgi:hypothetical protein
VAAAVRARPRGMRQAESLPIITVVL